MFARLDGPKAPWSPDEEAQGLDVCRKMDEFARIVPHLPLRRGLKVWGVPFAKAWTVLDDVVQRARERDKWPAKWDEFERIGRAACRDHKDVRYPA